MTKIRYCRHQNPPRKTLSHATGGNFPTFNLRESSCAGHHKPFKVSLCFYQAVALVEFFVFGFLVFVFYGNKDVNKDLAINY